MIYKIFENLIRNSLIGFWSINRHQTVHLCTNAKIILGQQSLSPDFRNLKQIIIEKDIKQLEGEAFCHVLKNMNSPTLLNHFCFNFKITDQNLIKNIHLRGIIEKDKNNIPRNIRGICINLSHLKKIEHDELINIIKLAHIGENAAYLYHELSSPMMALNLLLGSLLKNHDPKDEEQIKSILSLEKISSKLSKLMVHMRHLTTSSSGRIFETVTLLSTIRDALDCLRDRLELEKFDLLIEVSEEILINCNPTQITQVFSNLIINAMQANLHDQKKWLKVQALIQDDKVIIKVSDSGKNVTASIAKKMMKPFFTTKGCNGSGLGLPLCSEIIEHHHGLFYHDASGAYTAFIIELPLVST